MSIFPYIPAIPAYSSIDANCLWCAQAEWCEIEFSVSASDARKATYTVVILVNLYYAYCLHLGELFTRAELWWRSMSTAEDQITYENGIVSPVFFSFYTKFKFLFVLLVCLSVCLPMCLTLPLLSIQVRFDAEYADQFEEGTKVAFGAISHGKTWRWSG